MEADDVPRSDVERQKAGPPIGWGADRRGLGGWLNPGFWERRPLIVVGSAHCHGVLRLVE